MIINNDNKDKGVEVSSRFIKIDEGGDITYINLDKINKITKTDNCPEEVTVYYGYEKYKFTFSSNMDADDFISEITKNLEEDGKK